jgi:mono/diheme cytochrome c family protein
MNRTQTMIVATLMLVGMSTAHARDDAADDAPFNRSYLLGAKVAEAGSPAVVATARKHTGSTISSVVERGRYLIRIGGCNDCHTAGYPEAAGKLPEGQWLTGSAVGFQGPWGTTYPANLRLAIAPMSEAQWLARARSEMRPPMPWFNLRDMTDDDLKAIYHYVRQIGPAGQPAPAYAAPGQKVDTPYIVFEPQNVTARHARTH